MTNELGVVVRVTRAADNELMPALFEFFAKILHRNGDTVNFREKRISKNGNPHNLQFAN
jgi:hypothetical protein